MSWKNGSQPATTVCASCRNARAMASSFAIKCRWRTITPRGAAVDPDVYCSNARSSGAIARAVAAATPTIPSSVRSASVSACASHASTGTSSHRPRSSKPSARDVSLVVSTIAGRASSTTGCSRGRSRARRGAATGTATTPALRQPRNAAMKSNPDGWISRARSPWRQRSRRSAATRPACAATSAYVHRLSSTSPSRRKM